ncbi:hypothetical protein BC938DRAFT_478691 [Jimgerdemannia flammicorona]|uniref:Uncharacterized protein n=1 Tax=Jimgerdemannia flammicorona TaxID=994334 RepID=A0A433QY73_9FUNG|nr:hypothetical protein BC938DRAFT_478691 [Jimgerdemannia flammicorona]
MGEEILEKAVWWKARVRMDELENSVMAMDENFRLVLHRVCVPDRPIFEGNAFRIVYKVIVLRSGQERAGECCNNNNKYRLLVDGFGSHQTRYQNAN